MKQAAMNPKYLKGRGQKAVELLQKLIDKSARQAAGVGEKLKPTKVQGGRLMHGTKTAMRDKKHGTKGKVRYGCKMTKQAAASFRGHLEKIAKEQDEHFVRRMFLGNPISSAISAKKGRKTEAYGEALGHALVETAKGTAIGAGSGAVLGLGAGAAFPLPKIKMVSTSGRGGLPKLIKGLKATKFRRIRTVPISRGAVIGGGGLLGALLGAAVGANIGAILGNLGSKATEIHRKHT